LNADPQDGDIEAVISAGPGEYWNGGKRAEVSGSDLGDHACSDAFARVCGDRSRSRALNLIVRAVATTAQPCRR
jgi:hypothetical protein